MKITVGLEIHVLLNTERKLFSPSLNLFSSVPNIHINEFDQGVPGILPILNILCIDKAILASLIIKAKINSFLSFDRKHYKYRDLPLGYQITQHENPIGTNGEYLNWEIKRLHVEADAGRSINNEVDLNRCGCPLIEIVTEPRDLLIEEVQEFLHNLRSDLILYNVTDGRMELGHIRFDINVSSQFEENKFARQEIKNLNSIKKISTVIYSLLEKDFDKSSSYTWGWNDENNTLSQMRKKEIGNEYMYLPESDLSIIDISEKIKTMREIFHKKEKEIKNIKSCFEFFKSSDETMEKIVSFFGSEQINELILNQVLNKSLIEIFSVALTQKSKLSIEYIIKLFTLLQEGKITKSILTEILASSSCESYEKDIEQFLMEDLNVSSTIKKIIAENSSIVEKYLNGNKNIINGLVGKIMKCHPKVSPKSILKQIEEIFQKIN